MTFVTIEITTEIVPQQQQGDEKQPSICASSVASSASSPISTSTSTSNTLMTVEASVPDAAPASTSSPLNSIRTTTPTTTTGASSAPIRHERAVSLYRNSLLQTLQHRRGGSSGGRSSFQPQPGRSLSSPSGLVLSGDAANFSPTLSSAQQQKQKKMNTRSARSASCTALSTATTSTTTTITSGTPTSTTLSLSTNNNTTRGEEEERNDASRPARHQESPSQRLPPQQPPALSLSPAALPNDNNRRGSIGSGAGGGAASASLRGAGSLPSSALEEQQQQQQQRPRLLRNVAFARAKNVGPSSSMSLSSSPSAPHRSGTTNSNTATPRSLATSSHKSNNNKNTTTSNPAIVANNNNKNHQYRTHNHLKIGLSAAAAEAQTKLALEVNNSLVHLGGPSVYACQQCRTHLTCHDDIISKSFHGRHGRAYLLDHAVNVTKGPSEDRLLMTGLHSVCDLFCQRCRTLVGWTYEKAYEASQKYKEGKYIVEKIHLYLEPNDQDGDYDDDPSSQDYGDRFRYELSLTGHDKWRHSSRSCPPRRRHRTASHGASSTPQRSSSGVVSDRTMVYEYPSPCLSATSSSSSSSAASSISSDQYWNQYIDGGSSNLFLTSGKN